MKTDFTSCIITSDEIRSIILNAEKIKNNKCQHCQGSGYLNWNGETGDDERPGKLKDWSEDRTDGYCEKCFGIGFLDVFNYEED